MPALDELVSNIRDLVNRPRTQQRLRKNPANWQQLCSSLDVLGDSELAITAYLTSSAENRPGPRDSAVSGTLYLTVYGVFQALVLQQDALRHACESLNVALNRDAFPKMNEVRDIRNSSAGHPIRRTNRRGKPATYHGIARISLTAQGFSLYSFAVDGTAEVRAVDVPELVEGQTAEAESILELTIDQLEREADEHRRAFVSKKLMAAFPDTIWYPIEKLVVDTHSEQDFVPASVGLDLIVEVLDKFREMLAERDIEVETYPGVKDAYDLLDYPLRWLRHFFDREYLDRQQAYINARFVRDVLRELAQMAQEIDKEYAPENEPSTALDP